MEIVKENKMLYIIGYDVNTETKEGKKRLAQVAKECKNKGQRVQNSLFECELTGSEYAKLKKALLDIIDEDQDSLRIYNLGVKYNTKIECYGCKQSYDPKGVLIL